LPVEVFATGIKMESSDQSSFRSRSRDQDEFWATNINRSTHFLRYLGGVATFCPLNSRRIKRSRASERSDQAIKDNFHQSRFLIPVTNASTGNVYVTTPWITTYQNDILEVIIARVILQSDWTSNVLAVEQIQV